MKNKELKAYIVTAVMNDYEKEYKSSIVVAYGEHEAEDIFIRFLKAKGLFNYCAGFVSKRVRKSKKNEHYITKNYYIQELEHIEKLEKEVLNK